MKNKNVFLAAQTEQEGKTYAMTLSVPAGNNLVSTLEQINGLQVAEICATRRGADRLVGLWDGTGSGPEPSDLRKCVYLVINIEVDGKHHAYTRRVGTGKNLLNILRSDGHIKTINSFNARRDADKAADSWNETYRSNGTWLHSCPA